VNNFALTIWYDEGRACTFYTVKWVGVEDDDLPSETDHFFDTYADPRHPLQEKALQLFRLITESIGNKYGATDDFFDRTENLAQALPPKPKVRVEEIHAMGLHFPLRLFCYRVSERLVVLLHGGIKDARTAQDSDLSMKFREAQQFVKRIEGELRSGRLIITDDGRYLMTDDGKTDIIL
jgi:hypothetical protein